MFCSPAGTAARPAPCGARCDRRDSGQRLGFTREERLVSEAAPRQQRVDAAQQRVQQPQPHQRHQHVRQQVGQQHHRLDEQRARQPVHHHRQEQPKHGLHGDVECHVPSRQLHAVPEALVLPHLGVVVQTDPVRRAQQVPVRQADLHRPPRRPRIEQHEADQRRQHQRERGQRLASATRAEGRKRPGNSGHGTSCGVAGNFDN